jgi:DNA-binding HxlR family transcriptional regulator/DNA-binding response OmpR family regulator
MSNRHSHDEPSAPEYLLDSVSLLSKKWHPAVVRCLADSGGLGYSDLEDQLDGVSAKVLTDALEELQEYDIIEREELSQSPLRVNYTLTERGQELDAIIGSLADWGETYLTTPETEQVVLVADDDKRFLTMHEAWLEDGYTVRTASDGEEALGSLDTDVGVVVLDRRMPGLSGEQVLDWIRTQGYDIRVVMVTAEEPNLDVLDMNFDEYLTKPVLKDELRDVVTDLFERREYGSQIQEYLALRSKQALLEAERSPQTLEESEEYQRLQDRVEDLDATSGDIEAADPETLERITLQGQQ